MYNIMGIFSSLETLVPFFLPWAVMIISMIFTATLIIFGSKTTKKKLPPSPRKLPIIGNIHQLGSNPNYSLQALSQKHGPVMLLHLGSTPTLVASSPEAAEEIMKTQDVSFCSRPSITMSKILLYGSVDITFSPYGELWRQLKSIVVVHVLSNTRVKSFKNMREKQISLMIGALGESCGSLVDMGPLLASYTNNTISMATLGRTYEGSRYTGLVREFVNMFTAFCVGDFIPWLSWVDRVSGVVGRAHKLAKELDEFLEDVIEEHVNRKKAAGDDAKSHDQGQDFVDILLDVQKDNTMGFNLHRDTIKANLLEIFVAGTDTTYATIEWAFSELVKHPRVMKKVQDEVTEIAQGRSMILEEDLEKMVYLKAAVKETLRLHPPGPFLLPRKSIRDVKLMGYDVPAGTRVMVHAWAIGRDPAVWEQPTEFRPERFLNSSINYKGLHGEWIPFGGGRRACPGSQFAVAVMELALANIVYKFDLGLPNGEKNEDMDMTQKYGMVLRRKASLIVIPTPRF